MKFTEYKFEDLPNLVAENNRLFIEVREALAALTVPKKVESDIMSINEASDFLNLTVATIYSMVNRKQLPYSKRGKKLYFSRIELTEYVRAGRVLTNTEVKENAVRNAAKAMKGGTV